jgi:Neocarzinostatin family
MRGLMRSAALVVVTAMALVGAVGVAGAAEPKLRGNPTTGLVDFDRVRVSGTGFAPSTSVGVVQCVDAAVDRAACSADLFYVVTDAAGDLAWTMTVRRSITTAQGDVDCAAADGACEVAAVIPGETWTFLDSVALGFDPSVPPGPTLVTKWTIDEVGSVDEDGVATVRGTFQCTRTAYAAIHLYLQQEATGVRTDGFGLCRPTRTRWTLKVRIRHSTVGFEPGPATAILYGYGFEYYEPDEQRLQAEVELRSAP